MKKEKYFIKTSKNNQEKLISLINTFSTTTLLILEAFNEKTTFIEMNQSLDSKLPDWLKKEAFCYAEKAYQKKETLSERIAILNNEYYKVTKNKITINYLDQISFRISKFDYRHHSIKKIVLYLNNNQILKCLIYYDIKKKAKKPLVLNIMLIIFIAVFLYSLTKIIIWYINGQQINNLEKRITNITEIIERDSENVELVNPPIEEEVETDYWYYTKIPLISVNFDELKSINADTVAFIRVNGTNINYPIVQTNNNDHYLTHAFDGTYNSAGWAFADYRNDLNELDKNTIIYGHGRLDNTVFGSLRKILTSTWQNDKNNYIIHLSTPTLNTLWQVFSVYETTPESYYLQTKFINDDTYQIFLNEMINRSAINFNTTISSSDKILTLSTCTLNDKGRVVLQAKLIKQEQR